MEFELKGKPVAGSASAILQDESVRRVYGTFGDGCLRCYNMDIRQKRQFMSATTLRQVRSFIDDFGADDAIKIIKALFGVAHEGRWHGEAVGKQVFAKSHRWMAEKLLIEAEMSGTVVDDDFDAERNAIELERVKARIKSRLV